MDQINQLYFVTENNTILPLNCELITYEMMVNSINIFKNIITTVFILLKELITLIFYIIANLYTYVFQDNHDIAFITIVGLIYAGLIIYDNIMYAYSCYNTIVYKIEHYEYQINVIKGYLHNFEKNISIILRTNKDEQENMKTKINNITKKLKKLDRELNTYQ